MWQHFVGNARENPGTAHARGSTRACIFSEIDANDHIFFKTNFMVIGNKLVKIHLSINNKDKKYEKKRQMYLVFFLDREFPHSAEAQEEI